MCSALLGAPVLTEACGPASAPSQSKGFSSAQTHEFDKLVQASISQDQLIGAVVSIVDPHQGVFLKSYGTADVPAKRSMEPDDHYRIASVSKTLTATAILQLADSGRLSLSDTLDKYVPGVPNGNIITIRELLAMRAGVFNFIDDKPFIDSYNTDPLLPTWKPADIIPILQRHAADFTQPDQKSVYSDSNYILLGLVLEKVTQVAADRWITEHVIRPLGLGSTSFPTTPAMPNPFAHGYDTTFGSVRDLSLTNPNVPWTAGAIVSTVPDMSRYAKDLATGQTLKKATQAERLQFGPFPNNGPRLQYGLGITQIGDWLGHDGAIFGYSDMVFYLPSQDASLVVMVNKATTTGVLSINIWIALVKYLYPNSLPRAA
ncbi:MAG: beta-lactamase family protein [Candidatus Dormibacteraeota bacterium]|nr:beta-lactamase family protein [Candidatus Dormibacteraeota bacterium]